MSDDKRKCYYPDGTHAINNVPCTSDENTACCGTVDLCLTNGLCINAGHQPYILSRGACTSKEWGTGCPQYCLHEVDVSRGVSVVNRRYKSSSSSTYCCGTPVSKDGEVVCPFDQPEITVQDGNIIFGRAALTNATASASDSAPTSTMTGSPDGSTGSSQSGDGSISSCNDVAIGAGVGVPLGVIALLSIVWAIWERRRRNKQGPIPAQWAEDTKGSYPQTAQQPPAELGDTRAIHQIMDSSHR